MFPVADLESRTDLRHLAPQANRSKRSWFVMFRYVAANTPVSIWRVIFVGVSGRSVSGSGAKEKRLGNRWAATVLPWLREKRRVHVLLANAITLLLPVDTFARVWPSARLARSPLSCLAELGQTTFS